MKGQSSIEYLVTYGWMLAVVGIVSGALYGTGYMNFCSSSAAGMDIQQLQLDDFGVSNEEELQMVLENRDPQAFQHSVKQIELENRDTGETSIYSPNDGSGIEISPGTRSTIGVPGINSVTGCNNFNVEITYDRGDIISNQKTAGTLAANIEIIEEVNQPYEPSETFAINLQEEPTGTYNTGETVELEYDITNEGDATGEDTITLEVTGPEDTEDEQTIELEPEETETYQEQFTQTGDYNYEITTSDQTKEGEFTIEDEEEEEEESEIELQITNIPNTIEEGETLEIEYEIENNREEDEEDYEITLLFENEEEQTIEQNIGAEETTEDTITYDTEDEEPGEYEIQLTSEEDDSETETVEITETGAPNFQIENFESPNEAETTETIEATVDIENTGETEDTQEIELRLGEPDTGLETLEQQEITLGEDGTETVEFETEIPEDEETGEREIAIFTEQDEQRNTIQINEQEEQELQEPEIETFETDFQEDAGGQGPSEDELTVDWAGSQEQEELVEVEILVYEDAGIIDDYSQTFDPSSDFESGTEQFTFGPPDGDPDEVELSFIADNGEETVSVSDTQTVN